MSLVLVFVLFVAIRLGQILPRVLILVCFSLFDFFNQIIFILFNFLVATEYTIRTTPFDSFGNGGPCPACGERSTPCLAPDSTGSEFYYSFIDIMINVYIRYYKEAKLFQFHMFYRPNSCCWNLDCSC